MHRHDGNAATPGQERGAGAELAGPPVWGAAALRKDDEVPAVAQ